MTDEERAQEPGSAEHSRRRTVLVATGVVVGAMGAMLGVPVLTLFAAPVLEKRGPEGNWIPTGIPAETVSEEPVALEYRYPHQEGWYEALRTRRVVAMRQADGEFQVLDTTCTHLQCGVSWSPDRQQFLCPCHGGVFDANGRPVAGPVSEPLKQLQARVNAEGELEVMET